MSKKEEKPLTPKIDEVGGQIKDEDLKEIARDLKETGFIQPTGSSTDSYFRGVLDKLFDTKEVSSKTEYLNVQENFNGTKLEFYASFGNMPYLRNFMKTFETKRISLERKGRKEILMGLQERKQEMEAERMQNLRNFFNV
jgi:hypothetical protein